MLAKIEPVAKPLTICWARSCTSARNLPERRKPSDARRGEIFRQRSRRTCDFAAPAVFWPSLRGFACGRYSSNRASGMLRAAVGEPERWCESAAATERLYQETGDRSGEVFGRGCVDGPARQRRHARDAAGTNERDAPAGFLARDRRLSRRPSEIVAASPARRRLVPGRGTHDKHAVADRLTEVTKGHPRRFRTTLDRPSVAGAADLDRLLAMRRSERKAHSYSGSGHFGIPAHAVPRVSIDLAQERQRGHQVVGGRFDSAIPAPASGEDHASK